MQGYSYLLSLQWLKTGTKSSPTDERIDTMDKQNLHSQQNTMDNNSNYQVPSIGCCSRVIDDVVTCDNGIILWQ
jgi:hypothetical protein